MVTATRSSQKAGIAFRLVTKHSDWQVMACTHLCKPGTNLGIQFICQDKFIITVCEEFYVIGIYTKVKFINIRLVLQVLVLGTRHKPGGAWEREDS